MNQSTNDSKKPKEDYSIAALVFAVIGLLLFWFPFAGFIGTLGMLLAMFEYSGTPREFPLGTVLMGLIGTAGAIFWSYTFAIGSCPHVYAFDGQKWHLEADMLSGSFFAGAESNDLARIDHISVVDGKYKLRLVNERQERDYLDLAELVVVDHPSNLEALASSDGQVVLVQATQAPVSATDSKGRDLLPLIVSRDESTWQGWPEDHDPSAKDEPRDVLELTMPLTPAEKAKPNYLVLRAQNTQIATNALYRYLGKMGHGIGTLLHWAEQDRSYPYRQRIADEIEKLGIPLHVEVMAGNDWSPVKPLHAIGPAAMRTIAIALPDMGEAESVRVRLVASPQFWEIDQVGIALAAGEPKPKTLGALDKLAAADADRLLLREGDQNELEFEAPEAAQEGISRAVFIHLRGYYEVDIGGRGWINPVAMWRHRIGADSLPRFLLRSVL